MELSTTDPIPTELIEVAVLPLRDVVVYPHMVIPLFVGREKSVMALDYAMSKDKKVFLSAQKDAAIDNPLSQDLFEFGTVSTVLQMLKLPDGTIKVLVEGVQRARIVKYLDNDDILIVQVEIVESEQVGNKEVEALIRSVMSQFEQYIKLYKKIPAEILGTLTGINNPGRLADTIAAHLNLKIEEKQRLLELIQDKERLEQLLIFMESEIDLLQVEKKIRGRVKRQMEKSQREYYLKEQMTAIQKELGELEEAPNEIEDLRNKIEECGMSAEAKEKTLSELNKLKLMSPMSAEATVSRNYIDCMIGVPWKKRGHVSRDLVKAENILEADHYGLDKVKERILEYLAVQQRVKKLKGPILCLVGPPGVGKTSLGHSIARATNRKFVRMSLGGVRDEAEIRGHRRTYIGSMPGKIIQNLTKVGVRNPLFLLDEIDKMAMDFRGDPASALLEVLDPEQNHTFNDHYLEVDYDLSDVMFIATSNSLNIPGPLLDRMEVIRIAGYTEAEKTHIATRYLNPKQIKNNGLKDNEIEITVEALKDIIRYYTREAGVRALEREISKICRKVVKELLLEKEKDKDNKEKYLISDNELEKYLGVRRFRYGVAEEEDRVGQVNGLAWTEVGGELLTIEAAAMKGKGKTIHTGQLGDVMQESIHAALTVVRARANMLGILADFHETMDLHIHVPEGATPKDGPSAGIGMCVAIVSSLTKIAVRSDVAMTGEITLRGEVLPIGGLKEKLLAAHRARIKLVIIPEENRRDLKEIPQNIQDNLDIHPVKWIDEVFALSLTRPPEPLKPQSDVSSEKHAQSDKSKHEQDNQKGDEIRRH